MQGLIRILVVNGSALLAAITLTFIFLRLLPGDAISSTLLDSGADAEIIAARRTSLGLDDPLVVQYLRTASSVVTLEFGVSLLDGQPVAEKIGRQWGYTVTLAGWAICVAVLAGVLLAYGSSDLTASKRIRHLSDTTTALIQSIPLYWSGTILIVILSVWLNLLPASGASSILMPGIILGLQTSAPIARILKVTLNGEAGSGYAVTAAAKGLHLRRILGLHIARNAVGPAITAICLNAAFLLSGTVLVETVFNRPGLGRLMLDSVLTGDLPVLQGIVVLSAVAYSFILTIGQLLNYLIDPRLRSASL